MCLFFMGSQSVFTKSFFFFLTFLELYYKAILWEEICV